MFYHSFILLTGHRLMWIYTMYAGMLTGKYNDK